MKTEIEVLLECLIDELRNGENNPSEYTVDILSRYEEGYSFVKEYLDELSG